LAWFVWRKKFDEEPNSAQSWQAAIEYERERTRAESQAKDTRIKELEQVLKLIRNDAQNDWDMASKRGDKEGMVNARHIRLLAGDAILKTNN